MLFLMLDLETQSQLVPMVRLSLLVPLMMRLEQPIPILELFMSLIVKEITLMKSVS